MKVVVLVLPARVVPLATSPRHVLGEDDYDV